MNSDFLITLLVECPTCGKTAGVIAMWNGSASVPLGICPEGHKLGKYTAEQVKNIIRDSRTSRTLRQEKA